jgi:histidine triad (HIT) family protein
MQQIQDIEGSEAYDNNCLFCQISRGKVASAVVFEDEVSIAFLDHRPVFPGHCLLIPKRHHTNIYDLSSALFAPLFANAQLLAWAVKSGLQADGVFIGINNVVSQSVAHFHIHVVPRRWKDGLRGFFWPRRPYPDQAAMLAVQEALRAAIASARGDGADGALSPGGG